MIKTVNINLGGIVFQIDEDAFEALRKYLDSLNQYYKYTEGREDIVSDIESRISELFTESLMQSGFDVISLGDVEEVIEIMGRPEDFDDTGDRFEETASSRTTYSNGKRLYRDPDDAILAGVSSGLAAYWGVKDPLWIRLAFIATALFSIGTIGVIVYIILWAVVPEARTSSQKLEMRGETVNVNNLEKKIRESIAGAGDNLREFASKNDTNGALRNIVNGIGKIFGAIAKLFFVFIKVIVILTIIALVIGFLAACVGGLVSVIVAAPLSLKYIFASTWPWMFGVIGSILCIVIAMIWLGYIPFRIFGKYRVTDPKVKGGSVALFIVGMIMIFAAATTAVSYFSERETVTSVDIVPFPVNDTLYLNLNTDQESFESLDIDPHISSIFTFTNKLETASDWVELDIVPSNDEKIYLERTYRARGNSSKNARKNASSITYNADISSSGITFDPVFGLGEHQKWRNQTVSLRLRVPDSMVIAPQYDMASIIDDADNTKNASSYQIAGNRWMMADGVLVPLDSKLNMGSPWSKRHMKKLEYSNFDEISVSGDIDVEIVYGETCEVYLAGNAARNSDIEVDRSGSKLTIHSDGWDWADISIGFLGERQRDPKFFIALPVINELDVHGQADVILTDWNQGSLTLDMSDQGYLQAKAINVDEFDADLRGQSTLYINGKAKTMNLRMRDQADIDGEDFTVEDLELDMGGQSDAEFKVTDRVTGTMRAQSDFEYWGSPDLDISTSGQADVDRKD